MTDARKAKAVETLGTTNVPEWPTGYTLEWVHEQTRGRHHGDESQTIIGLTVHLPNGHPLVDEFGRPVVFPNLVSAMWAAYMNAGQTKGQNNADTRK